MSLTTYRQQDLFVIQLPDNKFEIKQIKDGYLGESLAVVSLSKKEMDLVEFKAPVEFCRFALNKFLQGKNVSH